MKITVTLYGRYKHLNNSSQLQLDLPDNATIRHLIDAFIQRYPEIQKDKKRIMVTKNNTFAPPNTPLTTTDSLSIAPPLVSGG